MDVSDEDDDEGFVSRFNDDVEDEEEEGFSFYDDVEEEEEEGFASEFYKAGSDWSCLVTPENKKMKQADLFQIWGLQKISPETKQKTKQTDLFQIWGLQKPSPSTSSASSSSAKKTTTSLGKRLRNSSLANDSPRQCPFYKKLPGLTLLLLLLLLRIHFPKSASLFANFCAIYLQEHRLLWMPFAMAVFKDVLLISLLTFTLIITLVSLKLGLMVPFTAPLSLVVFSDLVSLSILRKFFANLILFS